MATMHGYMDGSYDYKQMYNIQDLNGSLPTLVVHEDTLLHVLTNTKGVSKFKTLVENTKLPGILNSRQGDFTLFVPIDSGIPNAVMNGTQFKTRQTVLYHMLEHAVPVEFVRGSRSMMVNTRLPGSRLLIENYGQGPVINRFSKILGYQYVGGASVYFIDRILPEGSNPLSNSVV